MRYLYCLTLILFINSFISAQTVPQEINYQAVVRDSLGAPLPEGQSITFNVRFFDESLTQIHATTVPTNIQRFGIVSFPIDASAISDKSTIYSIEVSTVEYGVIGNTIMKSVPYALYAEGAISATVADSIKNFDITNFQDFKAGDRDSLFTVFQEINDINTTLLNKVDEVIFNNYTLSINDSLSSLNQKTDSKSDTTQLNTFTKNTNTAITNINNKLDSKLDTTVYINHPSYIITDQDIIDWKSISDSIKLLKSDSTISEQDIVNWNSKLDSVSFKDITTVGQIRQGDVTNWNSKLDSSVFYNYVATYTEIDGDISNEIQDLNLTSNILTITNNGTATSIDLTPYLDNTNTQLTETEVDAFVANNGYITDADDADADPTNEIQDLELTGNSLTITNNGTATSIDLNPYLDNTNTQLTETEVDAFVANNGYITDADDADADPTNEIQDLELTGNSLTITNNGTATSIDLTSFKDNLGDHTAIQNIKTNGKWLSYDNTDEGVFVNSDGSTNIQSTNTSNALTVQSDRNGNVNGVIPTLRIANMDASNNGDATILFEVDGDVNQQFTIGIDDNGGNRFKIDPAGQVGLNTFVIEPNGNVGINRAGGIEKLEINGNAKLDTIKLDNGVYFQDGTYQSTASTDNQNLTYNGATGELSIANGNSVFVANTGGGDNWGAQAVVTDNNTIQGDGTSGNPLRLNGGSTDDQILTLTDTNLEIEDGNSVNLSSINTDNQNLTLFGTDLSIEDGNSVDLIGIQDNLGNHTATKNIQTAGNWINNDADVNEGLFIDTDGNIGIGTNTPDVPLTFLVNGATRKVGITQNSSNVGGGATMELTTEDNANNQATRLLLRGGADNANIEFYSGSAGSETQTMFIGGNGKVTIPDLSTSGMVVANGTGQLSTQAIPTADNWGADVVISDATLTGNGTAASPLSANDATLADNGLTLKGDTVELGGNLNKATSIGLGTFNMFINSNSTGEFFMQDEGQNVLALKNDRYIDLTRNINSTRAILEVRNTHNGTNGNNGDAAILLQTNRDANIYEYTIGIEERDANSNFNSFKISNSSELGTNDRFVITSAGNVGIGTDSPSTALDVNGQIRIRGGAPAVGKVLTASGTGGTATWETPGAGADNLGNHTATTNVQLAGNWLSNDGGPTEGINISNTGQVGINIVPTSALHLANNSSFNVNDGYINNVRQFRMMDWDDDSGLDANTYWLLARDNAFQFYSGGVVVGNYANGTWPAGLPTGDLVVKGNVGIGTTNPSQKLDVNGTVKASALQVVGAHNIDAQGGYMTWNDPCCSGGTSFINQKGGGTGGFSWEESTVANVRTTNMTLSGAGNLGIGTATPGQKLTIAGTGNVLGVDNASSFAAKNAAGTYETFLWPRFTNNGTYLNYGTGGFNIRDHNSSAVTMFMTDDNKVGIGNIAPSTRLHVTGATGESAIMIDRAPSQASIEASTVSSNWMIIDGNHTNNGKAGINFYSSGDVIIAQGGGNVGIGTAAPNTELEVNGTTRITEPTNTTKYLEMSQTGDNTKINSSAGSDMKFQIGGTNQMIIQSSGNVVISDGNLEVSNGDIDVNDGSVRISKYLEVTGSFKDDHDAADNLRRYHRTGISEPYATDNVDIGIDAKYNVRAAGFIANSDRRIKKDITKSTSSEDLEILNRIEIVDYKMKDTINHGRHNFKKVIAQQVKEVYPLSVSSKFDDVVPDIYSLSKIKNNWIPLTDNIAINDTIKVIYEKEEKLFRVLEVGKNGFKIDLDYEGEVFVYGHQIHDMHAVDYEAISMLNVSATQEIYRHVQALEKENKALKQTNITNELRIENLEASITSEKQEDEEVQELLKQLQERLFLLEASKTVGQK